MTASATPPATPGASASLDPLAAAVRPWIMAAVVTTVFAALIYALADTQRFLWFKSLHIIAVVAWFAGIFYLPRLFVYHAAVPPEDTAGHERFCTMERKLYRFVTPFLVMAVSFGTMMVVEYGMDYFLAALWLHIKITLVLLVMAYHLWLGFHGRALRQGRRTRDHKFYRVINELPVLVLFAIIFLVVFKPTL